MIKIKSIPLTEEQINQYLITLDDLNESISSQSIVQNSNPLHLEIGCGNGHFLNERSRNLPDINFIGLDISRKRVLKSIYKVFRREATNIRFINSEGRRVLEHHFDDHSINTAYLNFPDPWPKRKHHKNRIFKPEFLDLIYKKLEKNGTFYAVSDHKEYFFEMLGIIEKNPKFINAFTTRYRHELEDYEISLYEEKWRKMDKEIYYLKFTTKIENL